ARQAHNLKVAGSNPAPATSVRNPLHSPVRLKLIPQIKCLTSPPRQAQNLKASGPKHSPETNTVNKMPNMPPHGDFSSFWANPIIAATAPWSSI
ncbi:hypothetical protein, partial [Ruegeria lacuscaerulensis]|uniref:hypothetical protein n=1 Tax=Ruegeria lacuscaerulensis TaxID=55218 RepID=UPI001BE40133